MMGPSRRRALIVGVTGQDGAYLARHLLEEGYEVHGTSRDAEMARSNGLAALGIQTRIQLHSMSPADFRSVLQTVDRVQPDEIYNLSGQSSVALSFTQPTETIESIVTGTLNILEVLRLQRVAIRFYNAGSSEIFGDTGDRAVNETAAFRPKSPYGVAKAASVSLVSNYRDSYGLFACSGILFNHESPLRPERFLTRKVTAAAARIANGRDERLRLGNLSFRRDFGWAPDYVAAMAAMLKLSEAEDLVIASGEAHSLEDFVRLSFEAVELDWREHVDFDASVVRPSDIAYSLGDAAKAKARLGWQPTVRFQEIVERMVRAEMEGAGAMS